MKINVCIPTRGKPEWLLSTLPLSLTMSRNKETKFVVGFDRDEEDSIPAEIKLLAKSGRVIVSVADREDSLGAKYNRCAANYPADFYVMGVDDVAIMEMGWDGQLEELANLIPDGISSIHFGSEPHGEYLPSCIASSHKLAELSGGFCPEWFPFWWNNTWNYEIGEMIGRIFTLRGIRMAYPAGEFPEPPRRDIAYWAEVFDRLRSKREAAADRIIEAMDEPEWRKKLLKAQRKVIVREQLERNKCLRDPGFARALAKVPDVMDERHQRLKDLQLEMQL